MTYTLPSQNQLWDWLRSILSSDLLTAVTGEEETTEAIENVSEDIVFFGFRYLLDEARQQALDFIEASSQYSDETKAQLRHELMVAAFGDEPAQEVKH